MPPVKKPKTKPNSKPAKAAETAPEETTPVVSGQLQKKLKSIEERQKPQRGVVFVKHLPHGFFEEQLKSYFEQFGAVTRLRLARSKTTGGTKGYAFVEFQFPEVAEVAAETMDNYLMFNKVVKAAYIPPEKQIYNFFKTSVRKVKNKAGKTIYVSAKTAAANRNLKKFNNWSDEAYQRRTASKEKRIKKLNKKYGHLGIDFNAIVTGSKKLNEGDQNGDASTDTKKTIKRKGNKQAEQSGKKSKKSPQLEDLLGSTLNEDSDDEDFVLQQSSSDEEITDPKDKNVKAKQQRKKSVSLEDLLGDTLNDDTEDSEYELNSGEDDDKDDLEDDNDDQEDDNDELEDDEESEDESNAKSKKTNKTKSTLTKEKKTKKSNVDRFENIIQLKKHKGGVQKASKLMAKKSKIGKPKNSMQAELTKELAKPLSSLSKTKKQVKKQKK